MTDTVTTAIDTGGEPSAAYKWRWAALWVILAAEVMDLLDSTIIGIAAPSIRDDLGGTYTSIQWLAAGYTLTFAIGLITGGRLGDIYGRRKMFLIGALGFTIVSALCGLAPTVGALIGFRLVQGLFAAVMIPQGFGIIKAVFPPSEIGKAFGAFGPVIGLSAVLGPIVAGGLIGLDLFGTGWRMVFLINIPLGIAAIVGGLKFLPESRSRLALHLDLVGMVLVMIGTVLLVYPLIQGRELGWPAWTFVSMAASVPVLAVFAWYEVRKQRRDGSALVVPGLFRRRSYTAGLVVSLIFFATMAGVMLVIGLFMQIGLGYSPLRAGLTMAPFALGLAGGAALAGSVLAPKFGRHVLHAGILVMALGVFITYLTLRGAAGDITSFQFIPGLLVTGFGMGVLISPLFSIVLFGIEQDEVGSASGVLNANQQLGSTIGVAVIATIFFALLGGQAHVAFDKIAPSLPTQLSAAGVPAAQQPAVIAQFRTCVHDHATQHDPSANPASCSTLVEMVRTTPGANSVFFDQGATVARNDFTDAMEKVLLVEIGLLGVLFALGFMLPNVRPELEGTPEAEPSAA